MLCCSHCAPFSYDISMSDPLTELLAIMAKLRDPVTGCAWDREQTFQTIAPYTIEEAYEVADAIEQGDLTAVKDELGDLLLQVVCHARIAEEVGAFDFHDVACTIGDKLVRRHPHVFGDGTAHDEAAVTAQWEQRKAEERAARAAAEGRAASALDGVANNLPALLRAVKLQKRAARQGFDWPEAGDVLDKIAEEIDELREELHHRNVDRLTDELGDVLFALVNLARHISIDPEAALRHTNAKFERRFRAIESALAAQGRSTQDADLAEMERLWQRAKAAETTEQR